MNEILMITDWKPILIVAGLACLMVFIMMSRGDEE